MGGHSDRGVQVWGAPVPPRGIHPTVPHTVGSAEPGAPAEVGGAQHPQSRAQGGPSGLGGPRGHREGVGAPGKRLGHEQREHERGVGIDLAQGRGSGGKTRTLCPPHPPLDPPGPPTLTGLASTRILPQDTASSGRAPESEPSNSCAVLT